MDVRFHYVGRLDPLTGIPIEYLQEIPARDLTSDEYAALSGDDQARVVASPIYVDLGA